MSGACPACVLLLAPAWTIQIQYNEFALAASKAERFGPELPHAISRRLRAVRHAN
jgi:hypothetical protein